MSLDLQTTLSLILQQLAAFFGTTVDNVMANAPMWLTKYGWYCVWEQMVLNMLIGMLIGCMIAGMIWAILSTVMNVSSRKAYIVSALVVVLPCVILAAAIPLIQCSIAPEIFGLQKLIELVT